MLKSYRNGFPTIGVLAGWQFYRTATNLSYLAPIFRGISRAAHDLGCNLLLGAGIGPSASPTDPFRPAWSYPSREHDFVPVGPWNTDGLIVASPLHSPARSEYIQGLMASGHPVLFIGSGENGPAIVADNVGGVLEAMRHLVDHGHRQIAFIAGSEDDMGGDTGDRLRAYQSACEMYGLAQRPGLLAYGRHVFDGGYIAMQQIMDSGAPFSAVLASNDESALGAMQAVQRAGHRIPQDVAFIGFDNRLEGAIHEPALSSVHIPLFNVGYRAVDLFLQHLAGKAELAGTVKVNTRLVVRQSCGCGAWAFRAAGIEISPADQNIQQAERRAGLTRTIATIIMNQSHNLTEEDGLSLCQRLVDTFTGALQSGDSSDFEQTLADALQRTAAVDDDTHIWQDAISVLRDVFAAQASASSQVGELVNQARLAISAQMQHQHRQYVVNERWVSSRLSLLTDRLLSALDEMQIYEILAAQLPEMGIRLAMLGLFDSQEDDPVARSALRDLNHPEQELIQINTRQFPPPGLAGFPQTLPLILILIPLVDPASQKGFIVFGTEHLDLYGAIVQQLGGALNTARLYRQATEGRKLAEEANQIKTRFLSTISHELRTPLNLIVGLSGILMEESDEGKFLLPETAQKDVERIHAYTQHLSGLINDVLDLATSDAGQLRLNMELVDLVGALRMVLESGSQLTADKGLAWRASLPETSLWVWGDRTRLRQVVLNLVNNAIKFTGQGEVVLSVEPGDGAVTVQVSDTGLGIPLQEQASIFDEFSRSERSILLGYPGLGLGLAICKVLVEMHGGVIGVHSSGVEGQGSTFYFTLPLVQPLAAQLPKIETWLAGEQNVLVLASSAGASQRLCDLLEQRGLSVQSVPVGLTAAWQASLEKSLPDAIVLDVSVETGHLWSTLKALKSSPQARGVPIMFYTASPDGNAVLNLDYLTKPVEPGELSQAVDQFSLMVDHEHPLRTFLVVDDDPNTLEMHARIVQSHSSSHQVLQACNGREALDILLQEKVDLVLLDLQMPEMDGFQVLEAMRDHERLRDIPVIVVTGKILTENDMARFNRGVTTVLKKGMFSMDEIVAHILNALERRRKLSLDAQYLVRRAMVYLHEHYNEPISRQDIARHVNIAEDYLTFCFRQELGITPIKYLQRYRLSQARLLLKTSQKSITEIAFAVGFSDSGYFSRIFHRETGLSPEAFREQA